LVQDRESGAAVLDAPVTLGIARTKFANGPPALIPATSEASGLKLLEAGTVNLPRNGPWNLRVTVRRGSIESVAQGTLNATAQD
jgi:hypothetical protein